jgi:prophage regulatory protein
MSDLVRMIGRARSSIYQDIANGRFPKPVKLGPRASAWTEQEVTAWVRERMAERDAR